MSGQAAIGFSSKNAQLTKGTGLNMSGHIWCCSAGRGQDTELYFRTLLGFDIVFSNTLTQNNHGYLAGTIKSQYFRSGKTVKKPYSLMTVTNPASGKDEEYH